MKVDFDNEKYVVSWKHVQNPDNQQNGKTYCFIKDISKSSVVAQGEAVCSKKEQYNRQRGRKVSMMRALQNLPKQNRLTFWTTYDKEIGLKK